MKTRFLAYAGATALVGVPASAYAATLNVTNVQVPYADSVSWNSNTLANGLSTGTGAGIAGEILLTTSSRTYATWCVDLFHDVSIGGSYTYTTTALMSDNSGASASVPPSNGLSATQLTDIGFLAYEGTMAMNASPSNDLSAAYQAAIWTVEYNLTGVTSSSSGFASEYTTVMDSLSGAVGRGGAQLSDLNAQGLFTAQNLYTSSIPEASTWAMMGLGFAGLGFAAFRRTRRTSVAIA
jgi:hypothetical protein